MNAKQTTIPEVERIQEQERADIYEIEKKRLNGKIDDAKSEMIKLMNVLNQMENNDTTRNSTISIVATNKVMEALDFLTYKSQGCGTVVIDRRRSNESENLRVHCKWSHLDDDGTKTVSTKEIFSNRESGDPPIEWGDVKIRDASEEE